MRVVSETQTKEGDLTMAGKKNRKANTENQEWEAPEGYDINAERTRGEGWIKKEFGNVVNAEILAVHEYKNKRGKTRQFLQMKLISKAKCQIDNPDFNEEADEDDDNRAMIEVELDEGSTVNCDVFKKLEDIVPYAKNGGKYNVWFVIGKKMDLDGGNTMWDLAAGPKLRCVKKPSSESPF
jgi:hypothetical protein